MDANIILKYKNISTPNLKKKAQIVFNAWIRKRDEGKPCINCGRYTKLQAGHFFPTSTHNYLRFHEHNTNGECLHCNYFNSQSHSYGYRVNLEKKLGKEDFDKLMQLGERKIQVKDDRFYFIEIIEKYKL